MKAHRAFLAFFFLSTAFGTGPGAQEARADFSDGKAGFAVRVQGEVIPYKVFAISVLPGETIHLALAERKPEETFSISLPGGTEEELGVAGKNWTAPSESGLMRIRIVRSGSTDAIDLNIFVLVPRSRVHDGKLNGYRIGSYPSTPLRGLSIYRPPAGFIEVTPENVATSVSPHFRLRQFICKQSDGYPKYVVLRPRLLLKLELLIQQVNAAGYRCDTFHVMSGFRTPFYNAAIGNVKYSRHQWGGAADIFIDESPRDGVMDDLNKDGSIDYRDAAVLYDLVDGLFGKAFYEPYVGGLGRYKKTASHGPFVHVDVRGFRARWGT